MLTTCTECGTRFRLKAEQLRQAEGQVRCGRCGAVFDAFVHLHGDDGTPWSLPTQSAFEVPGHVSEPETTASDDDIPAELHEQLGDTDDLLLDDGGGVEPRIDDLFGDLEEGGDTQENFPDSDISPDENDALAEELIALESESEPDRILDDELPPHDHLLTQPHHRRHGRLWTIGTVLLAILLGGQWINANRQALSSNLVIGSSLSALYALLGHPLAAPQALDAWQISNTNVTSDPNTPGALSITGNLANTADFSQGWPLLRVELTNRYGDALRARDFEPAQYLPSGQASTTPSPGMATHFRIDIVDPGPDAVGFQVAACLDLASGRVCTGNREHE